MYMRFLGLVACLSCSFTWAQGENYHRKPLFFCNWLGNTSWVLMQYQYSILIQGCLYSPGNMWFIFTCKLLENFLSQCISFSTLLVNIQLFKIVRNYRKLGRVVNLAPKRLIIGMIVLAALIAITSAVFWNTWFVTGSYLWVASNMSPDIDMWTNVSFSLGPAVSGLYQLALILTGLVKKLHPELRACMSASPMIKLWMLLALTGLCSNFMSTFHFIATIGNIGSSKSWFFWSNTVRFIHIICDSVIVMKSLQRSKTGREKCDQAVEMDVC